MRSTVNREASAIVLRAIRKHLTAIEDGIQSYHGDPSKFEDLDGDGRRDLLVNSSNVDLLRNVGGKRGFVALENQGPMAERKLAGHTTSPTTVDWDGNGVRDLLIGAEDGFLYVQRSVSEP